MRSITAWLRSLLPGAIPVVAAVAFVGFWIVAEAGRGNAALVTTVFVGLGIALSMSHPWLSHAALVLALTVSAVGIVPMPSSTEWPMWLGLAIAIVFISTSGSRTVRWATLPAGVLYAALATWLMVVRYAWTRGDTWISWTGRVPEGTRVDYVEDGSTGYVTWADFDSTYVWHVWLELAVVAALIAVVAWGAGTFSALARSRTEAARRARRSEEQLAVSAQRLSVQEERMRIARDLHDVLAHSLAVVVAQADGLRYLQDRPRERVDRALETIATAARVALGDIRLTVEGLREGDPDAPQPTLGDVDALLERSRETGLEVDRVDAGERRPLGAGAQIAVYRIVQESLTNALAHGGLGSRVRVSFDWAGPGLALTVVSTRWAGDEPSAEGTAGAGAASESVVPERAESSGNGVLGMTERARLVGGWLTAGAGDGEYRVTAFVPYPEPEPSVPARRAAGEAHGGRAETGLGEAGATA